MLILIFAITNYASMLLREARCRKNWWVVKITQKVLPATEHFYDWWTCRHLTLLWLCKLVRLSHKGENSFSNIILIRRYCTSHYRWFRWHWRHLALVCNILAEWNKSKCAPVAAVYNNAYLLKDCYNCCKKFQ